MPFDPFRRASRWVPEPALHWTLQLFQAGLCVWLVGVRVRAYAAYGSKTLWWGETLLFASFALAYVVRVKPLRRARGLAEIALPLTAAVLPFGLVHWPSWRAGTLVLTPLNPALARPPWTAALVAGMMACGHFLAVAGVLSLRRSFSITPEARELVTGGLYRFVRHPIYLGEILAATGVTLARLCPRNVVLLGALVALQLWRARTEERVLESVFPGYGAYRERTPFLLP